MLQSGTFVVKEWKRWQNCEPVAFAGASSDWAHASGLHAFCFHRC